MGSGITEPKPSASYRTAAEGLGIEPAKNEDRYMAFKPPKPETIARRALEHAAKRKDRKAELLRRIERQAKENPDSIYADLLAELQTIAYLEDPVWNGVFAQLVQAVNSGSIGHKEALAHAEAFIANGRGVRG